MPFEMAGFVTRATPQREDASFAAFYPVALALGVLLVSLRGAPIDLMHILFGSVLAAWALLTVAQVAAAGARHTPRAAVCQEGFRRSSYLAPGGRRRGVQPQFVARRRVGAMSSSFGRGPSPCM